LIIEGIMSVTPIKKILVANRGEIALRVIRACREQNIKSVAVFSEPDRLSPHVQMADEAYALGGESSQESYLVIDKIIDAMNDSGADAVHPGYGFLSENQEFAERIKQAGKIFIGPAQDAIEIMGNKTNARKKMLEASVPCVPGTEEGISNLETAIQTAQKIGFPILIKAAMGGRGKGMRLVNEESELESAIRSSQNEARQAFGDDLVYIEKFVVEPRHIEIQVLGDMHGNYVHLFERECSIQRRHQKVIEEAPSSILSDELREKMGQSAIDCAKSVNYFSAGTVEFLVDKDLNYYFLEMNTRLQVEHPVTEMITGVDIVKEMISIAEGRKLSIKQSDLRINGHAIESRIYAEDVFEKFMPSTGKITFMKASDGPGIREDSGYEQGNIVSPFYDPMISKLCAHAPSREEAIMRMKRALKEYQISGIKTTIPFCLMVLDHSAFVDGNYNTGFVDEFLEDLLGNRYNTEEYAAIASILIDLLERESSTSVVHRKTKSNWQNQRFN
jgi:propionyl-CoA carboxylase alpha chain